MRALTEDETKTFFEKLSQFIGKSIEKLINRDDEKHCFRLVKDRVYYVSESVLKTCSAISRKDLISVGVCFGKFTKSGKFRLHVTALDYLAQYAKHKIWIKPSAEMSFLYGNNVVKNGLGRITDGAPQNAGFVVYNMADIPLGFGISAHSTDVIRGLDAAAIVILHQADLGEYLRDEDSMI